MTKLNVIISSVLLILLLISSYAASEYYKKYITLTISIQKNNEAAELKQEELLKEHKKELDKYKRKYENVKLAEAKRNEEINAISVDYANLRMRFEAAQRANNNSGETSPPKAGTNGINDESSAEGKWILYREAVESFRNELELMNSAYKSCYELITE